MTGQEQEQKRSTLARLRALLLDCALAGKTIPSPDLAAQAGAEPAALPAHLETLIREDHAAGRPLLAALAVGKDPDGASTHSFFATLRTIGRYDGQSEGPEAREWLALEQDDAIKRAQTEREAYVEMVAWLAERMSHFGEPYLDSPPENLVGHEVFHGFQSNFEEMLWILQDVDVLEGIPLDPKGRQRRQREYENSLRLAGLQPKSDSSMFKRCRDAIVPTLCALRLLSYHDCVEYSSAGARYRIPRDQVRVQASSFFGRNPSFERVLNCFFDNAVWFCYLPEGRDPDEPFEVPKEFAVIMKLLSELGYAGRRGERYFWRGPVLPTDLPAYSWTPEDIHANRIQRLIRDMPADERQRTLLLLSQGVKLIPVMYLYMKGWHLRDAKDAVNVFYEESSSAASKAERLS
jgi:hypothetical protein